MVDFTKLEQATTWPFRIGGVMVHHSWHYMDDGEIMNCSIRVISFQDDGILCLSGPTDHQYKYFEHSFEPIEDWYYLNSKVERKKKGFGKWFSQLSE